MADNQFAPKQSLSQKSYAKSCDIINDFIEYVASLSIGQALLRHTDRLLWTVEKSAEWSVPTSSSNKHNSTNGAFGKPGPLTRPLPWILFLPMLIFLRVFRLFLSIIALLIGLETVKPNTMVRFIQVRRRRIRALRFLGLRKNRLNKMHSSELSLRERFYNIMSRAMCFRVTNTDLYEELTVKSTTSEKSPTKKRKIISDQDMKRKYIEILKSNCFDWEDVEDEEELIDRITQLAEDDLENESNYEPSEEDSATEDSMSDAEEDLITPTNSSPKHVLQRPSSHGSLTNEIIQEENEETDSATISANSDDESSQQLNITVDVNSSLPKSEENKEKQLLDAGITSDEYYSPMNSISASPEPKPEITKNNDKHQSEKLITSESQVAAIQIDSIPANNQPVKMHDANNGVLKNKTAKTKKRKNRRRFSNLLRRKRK